ncbi:hypothetical protein FOZ62_016989, partial [Perkinsus olseni]
MDTFAATAALKSCLRDKTKGSSSTCSLGSEASTTAGYSSDTTSHSEIENVTCERRSLSVTFADQQSHPDESLKKILSLGDTSSSSVCATTGCLDASTSTAASHHDEGEEAPSQSLATYHYVESYKDYNRRNSTWHPSVAAASYHLNADIDCSLADIDISVGNKERFFEKDSS